jgi:hypothetical protein
VGFGGERSNRVPLNIYYRASLTETLYLADDMAMDTGVLTRLAWQSSFYEPCWDKPCASGWGRPPRLTGNGMDLVRRPHPGLRRPAGIPAGEHTIQVPFQTFYVSRAATLW